MLPNIPMAPAPRWLLELIRAQQDGRTPEPIPADVPEGGRDNALTSMAGTMRRRGATEPVILAALQTMNAGFSSPLPGRDLERIAKSVSRYPPGEVPDAHVEAERRGNIIQIRRNGREIPTVRVMTASELDQTHLPEPHWVVPGLVSEGVTLLIGKPKMGKSWLALGLAVSVARGDRVMERLDVVQGEVLYLGLEDDWSRFQRRMRQMLGDEPLPCNLHLIAAGFPTANAGGLAWLDLWLGDHPECRMVVIDTMRLFRGTPESKNRHANAYDLDVEFMQPVNQMARKHHVAVILVHHERKLKGEDTFDTVSGTLGLTGSADTMFMLKRERSSTDGILSVTGRDIDESDIALSFDKERGIWTYMGDPGVYFANREREEVVTALLNFQPLSNLSGSTRLSLSPDRTLIRDWPGIDLITSHLGKTRKATEVLLSKLVQEGVLERPQRGRYRFNPDYEARARATVRREDQSETPAPGGSQASENSLSRWRVSGGVNRDRSTMATGSEQGSETREEGERLVTAGQDDTGTTTMGSAMSRKNGDFSDPLSTLISPKRKLITDPGQWGAELQAITGAPAYGVDTETTGLSPVSDRLVSIQISDGETTLVFMCPDVIPECMREFLEQPEPVWVMQNAAFDWSFFKAVWPDLVMTDVFDTMIARALITAGYSKGKTGLAAMAKHYLGVTLDKSTREAGFEFGAVFTPEQFEYAALDAEVTLALMEPLWNELWDAELVDIFRVECLAAEATADRRLHGIGLDVDQLQGIHDEVVVARDAARERVLADLGEGVNLNAPAQVKAALERIGVRVQNVQAATLRATGHPVCLAKIEYTALAKLESSFTRPLLARVAGQTGIARIYPEPRQMGAESGRESCASPNIQQIPQRSELGARIRGCFVAESGHVLVDADYSQIELRIIAEITGDEAMVAAYAEDRDLHMETAAMVLGVRGEPTRSDRQKAKALNFGLGFGMGAPKFRVYARDNYGVDWTLEEATEIRSRFFRVYSGVAAWHRRTGQTTKRGSFAVRTLGMRRRFLEGGDYTEALNTPVQGTGADILKTAAGLLVPEVKIVAMVHDEILVECREEHGEAVKALVEARMIEAGERYIQRVPVRVESKISRRWEK